MNKINAEDLIRQDIAALDPYTPGIYYTALAARLGRAPDEIIKLDANENPYGPPPAALRALAKLHTPHRYPDPTYRELRGALAAFTGVPVEQILAGAGSDELLALTTHLLLEPGDAVVTCPPTFAMYGFFAGLAGARVIEAPREADLTLDLAAVEAAVREHRPKLCFICAPNNPTGDTITAAALTRLLALPCILLLDEAYVEFAPETSMLTLLERHPNLVLLRTLSKAHALAGCRLGSVIARPEVIGLLRRIIAPYPLPTPTVAIALRALDDDALAAERAHLEMLAAERTRLIEVLEASPGISRVWKGAANFVLVRAVDGKRLVAEAARAGIRLRDQSAQPGLADCVRITVGTPEENAALIDFLRQWHPAESPA
jgi:histidinol-phosphate aminotransferase